MCVRSLFDMPLSTKQIEAFQKMALFGEFAGFDFENDDDNDNDNDDNNNHNNNNNNNKVQTKTGTPSPHYPFSCLYNL